MTLRDISRRHDMAIKVVSWNIDRSHERGGSCCGWTPTFLCCRRRHRHRRT